LWRWSQPSSFLSCSKHGNWFVNQLKSHFTIHFETWELIWKSKPRELLLFHQVVDKFYVKIFDGWERHAFKFRNLPFDCCVMYSVALKSSISDIMLCYPLMLWEYVLAGVFWSHCCNIWSWSDSGYGLWVSKYELFYYRSQWFIPVVLPSLSWFIVVWIINSLVLVYRPPPG